MRQLRTALARRTPLLFIAMPALSLPGAVGAQDGGGERAHVEELSPGIFVVSRPVANTVVLISRDSAMVVGPQVSKLVADVRELLAAKQNPSVRFVRVTPADSGVAYGDGGWGRTGALVLAHEGMWYGMRRRQAAARSDSAAPHQHAGSHTDAQSQHAGAPDVPTIGFSEVVQLLVGGHEVHVIRQRPGAWYADPVVHFEDGGVVYLGNIYTTDGYPAITTGSIDGMIETTSFFAGFPADRNDRFVPGRGAVTTVGDLTSYVAMLTAVRDRVQQLIADGKSEEEIVAAKPTAEFDASWGNGPVSPDEFAAMAARSLSRQRP